MEMNKLNQLRGIIAEKRIGAEDIADALNINIATYYRKLNGDSEFSISEAHALIKVLKLSEEEASRLFLKESE